MMRIDNSLSIYLVSKKTLKARSYRIVGVNK